MFEPRERHKSILEVAVQMGPSLEGRKLKDASWPQGCLIVGIIRGGQEIIPNGDTVLLAGDYLIVITDENLAADIKKCLCSATEH